MEQPEREGLPIIYSIFRLERLLPRLEQAFLMATISAWEVISLWDPTIWEPAPTICPSFTTIAPKGASVLSIASLTARFMKFWSETRVFLDFRCHFDCLKDDSGVAPPWQKWSIFLRTGPKSRFDYFERACTADAFCSASSLFSF